MNAELRVEVEPVESAAVTACWADFITTALRSHRLTADRDIRLLRVRSETSPDKGERDEDAAVLVAEAYDDAADHAVQVRGTLRALEAGDNDAIQVDVAAYQPAPSEEELELAFETVRRDERLAARIERERLRLYAPMPPVAGEDLQDGRTERVITVGLLDERAVTRGFLGVRLRDRAVLEDLPQLPRPEGRACEPSPPSSDCPSNGTTGQVWVSVFQGDTRIWRFQLVRPAASSGTNGSGAELRFVDYRGHRVLYRAHVPILNIEYFDAGQQAGCGPTYRDWQNQETCFEAPAGFDPIPGIRVWSAPAQTIIESGTDAGNFRIPRRTRDRPGRRALVRGPLPPRRGPRTPRRALCRARPASRKLAGLTESGCFRNAWPARPSPRGSAPRTGQLPRRSLILPGFPSSSGQKPCGTGDQGAWIRRSGLGRPGSR